MLKHVKIEIFHTTPRYVRLEPGFWEDELPSGIASAIGVERSGTLNVACPGLLASLVGTGKYITVEVSTSASPFLGEGKP